MQIVESPLVRETGITHTFDFTTGYTIDYVVVIY